MLSVCKQCSYAALYPLTLWGIAKTAERRLLLLLLAVVVGRRGGGLRQPMLVSLTPSPASPRLALPHATTSAYRLGRSRTYVQVGTAAARRCLLLGACAIHFHLLSAIFVPASTRIASGPSSPSTPPTRKPKQTTA